MRRAGDERSRAKPSTSRTSTNASSSRKTPSTSKSSSSRAQATKPSASSKPSTSLKPSASSKPSTSSKPCTSTKPSTSSRSSKTSSSSSKLTGSKSSTSTSKASSKTSNSSSSRDPSSTLKASSSSTSKGVPSRSSSRAPEKALSSSSRKPAGSTKTSSSTKDVSRTGRSSSNHTEKSKTRRDPSRGDREALRRPKNSVKGDTSSLSQRDKVPGDVRKHREKRKEEKTSHNREGGKNKSSASHTPGERDASQRETSISRSSRDTHSSRRPSLKETQIKETSGKEEAQRSSTKTSKDKHNRDEKERVKSSRPRVKSAVQEHSHGLLNGEIEANDSGVDAVQVINGQSPVSQEAEVVEQTQNSLETMESGISLSSPRDLSGDEMEVEESISSKMVEVDEDEDDGGVGSDDMLLNGGDTTLVEDDNGYSLSAMEQYSSSLKYGGSTPGDAEHPTLQQEEEEEDPDDYEEDFEDYESDFEEEEEDSGSSPGTEENEESTEETSESDSEDRNGSDSDPEMAAVLSALKQENDFENRLQRTYSIDIPECTDSPSPVVAKTSQPGNELTDPVVERSEEVEIEEKPKEVVRRPKTSRTFVNFERAKKKQMEAQAAWKVSGRGRMLLNMIQLDTVNMDLLTLSPATYETYIASFGHSNRRQVQVQTNEDALSEEVQTEEVLTRNKWTQRPPHISVRSAQKGEVGQEEEGHHHLPGPEDYLGVGGDLDPDEMSKMTRKINSSGHIAAFLSSASQVMLAILEEERLWSLADGEGSPENSTAMEGLGFFHPPVPLGSSVQHLLQNRPVPFVQFCPAEPTLLLSGHGYALQESHGDEDNTDDSGGAPELNEGGLLCLWSVQEPSLPQHILSCRAPPMAATFSPVRPAVVLAGLRDGSLAAWDLRESLQHHTMKIDVEDTSWRVRVPSYVTACVEETENEGSRVVAMQTVATREDVETELQGSFQVVTLSSVGQVTWWVVVQVPLTSTTDVTTLTRKTVNLEGGSGKTGVSPHLGAAPWARIALNRAATINIGSVLYGETQLSSLGGLVTCSDLCLDPSDLNRLYVATGSGAVAHCSRHSSKLHPRAFLPEIEPGCEAVCVAVCPHDTRYLLVGCSDGGVRLHSMTSERPLTSWQSAPDSSSITAVQWSPARPCVFYVLDSNARLHIWDLSAGDIFPVLTIEAGGLVVGRLCAFHIAPTKIPSQQPLHSVFASEEGDLVLRQVSPEFCTYEHMEDYSTELERFTYYVNII